MHGESPTKLIKDLGGMNEENLLMHIPYRASEQTVPDTWFMTKCTSLRLNYGRDVRQKKNK
jgi:hypothetical protein